MLLDFAYNDEIQHVIYRARTYMYARNIEKHEFSNTFIYIMYV